MKNDELIPAHEFCTCYNIEYAFLDSLEHSGLLTITTIEHQSYIPAEEMHALEKFVRLHYDLDINLAGIETIHHLLGKIESLQKEITSLRNSLPAQES